MAVVSNRPPSKYLPRYNSCQMAPIRRATFPIINPLKCSMAPTTENSLPESREEPQP